MTETVRHLCEEVEARGGNTVELHLSAVRELLDMIDYLRLQVVELEKEVWLCIDHLRLQAVKLEKEVSK